MVYEISNMEHAMDDASENAPSSADVSFEKASMPFVRARAGGASPISANRLKELAIEFSAKTVAQRYFGPAWIGEDGVPCVVFVAHDREIVKRVRHDEECAAVGWRWDISPSMLFSMTVMVRNANPKPHVRWMRPSSDSVVDAIRQKGQFLMTICLPDGQNTGWLTADFYSGQDAAKPSLSALDRMWSFPTPGIPRSTTAKRFDPFSRERLGKDEKGREIPMWAEPSSDTWAELEYKGPWADDLQAKDKARAAWGAQALRFRQQAAGFIQAIRDRHAFDGASPLFDSDGLWSHAGPLEDRAVEIARQIPLIGRWLAAMAGPNPDAKVAYDACFEVLHDRDALLCLLDKLMPLLSEFGDLLLGKAAEFTFLATLVDARVTKSGSQRPWIGNTGGNGLELKTFPIDMDAPLADVEELWRNGLEIIDLIDAGLRLTPQDFPAPLKEVCDAFRHVALEGTYDDAAARIQTMLKEAQEARQWSVPWGARVEVAFGPFTAVRIFEAQGEFSCLFLDAAERYRHVAIGLGGTPPRAASSPLIRPRDDDGEPAWNDDAELSLKLIAAAIVRDFIVVEDRETLFSARPMRRRIRGRDVRTVIYLPRVRYSTPNLAAADGEPSSATRTKHSVGPHLRRAGSASVGQRFLAQKYGIHVPEGFTFVRPHERGAASDEARIKVYRSRSASRMIFQEVSTAPVGARPAWFDFEKDCLRLLTLRGLRVVHQAANRSGDGGADLYAVDEDDRSWIVQCKCWALHRVVGPDVIRELHGAIALADKGSASASRGIVITTSRFSSGAIDASAEFGFELIDGEQFGRLLAQLT